MKNSSSTGHQSPASILLVDDNKHGLIARKTVLRELNYQVTTAQNGEEALGLFVEQHFDLVITDHKMPRMTGLELIVQIRNLRPATPVILLSGFVDPLGLDEKTTGADVVIAKSNHEVGHLLRATAKLLNRRTPRKPAKSQQSSQVLKAESAS